MVTLHTVLSTQLVFLLCDVCPCRTHYGDDLLVSILCFRLSPCVLLRPGCEVQLPPLGVLL